MAPVHSAAAELAEWLSRHRRILVLTGAGCSTASGIPDYRDAGGAWKRAQPVTWQSFTGDAATYRRYWARSSVGWPRFAAAKPNAAHAALVQLQGAGKVSCLVTQNVDGLHQRAGSRDVIDLHGRLDTVVCLGCDRRTPRALLQANILAHNPQWHLLTAATAPDGDADLDGEAVASFVPPRCSRCSGLLKPDVVFFGENVPRERHADVRAALEVSDAMLVAGSSLMVYSGFRIARMAAELRCPLAIVNRGKTRADALAALKIEADIGATLRTAMLHTETTRMPAHD